MNLPPLTDNQIRSMTPYDMLRTAVTQPSSIRPHLTNDVYRTYLESHPPSELVAGWTRRDVSPEEQAKYPYKNLEVWVYGKTGGDPNRPESWDVRLSDRDSSNLYTYIAFLLDPLSSASNTLLLEELLAVKKDILLRGGSTVKKDLDSPATQD